jgi:Fe-S oxidoreductase/nitrate reductase gamma subunit
MVPERELFWNIGGVGIFYFLAFVSLALFLSGVSAHIYVWLKSTSKEKPIFSWPALSQTLGDIFLGRRVFKGNLAAGTAHLLIFYGFVILTLGTAILGVHDHLHPFLTGKAHLIFELAMEIGGLLLLAGIVWALIRRYIQRVPRLERLLEDGLIPLWLLAVAGSGFWLESLRLSVQKPPWAHWSFLGWAMAAVLSSATAGSIYPFVWWGHVILSLSFIAFIPYSKLFHLVGAPAAFYLHHASEVAPEATTVSEEPLPDLEESLPDQEETAPTLELNQAVFFDACMRCGRCVQVCPSTGAGEPYFPRDFIRATRQTLWKKYSPVGDIRFLEGEQPISDKVPWYCTTCAACLEVCPVYGAAFKAVSQKRTQLVEEGKGVPDLMNQTLERLFNYDNPWVSSKRERAAWAKGLDIPVLKRGGNEGTLCYFVGCTTPFDARAQEIPKTFTNLLKRAEVTFGIIGDKEPCCGDIARVVGETGLFQEKRESCLDLFDRLGVDEVVTSSPHCFHTFRNEYPGRPFEVRHYSLVLKELLSEGRLNFTKSLNWSVTYHDPCYLGRHNRIFEEPREIIRAIPGVSLKEMAHCGPDSLCCGGGGGRMWQGQDLRGEVRMADIRIREAEAIGVEILITACPLCLIMLEDACKSVGLDGRLRVMDLNELVLQALE